MNITSTHEQEVEKEVQKYLAEDLIPINANPLNWWSDNQLRYPVLSKISRQMLCIPGTSVPCESSRVHYYTKESFVGPKKC